MIDGGGNNHQIERTDILKKAADENFENLRKQFATGVQRIRDESDESIDIRTFLRFRSILNWKRIEKANEWCCRQTEEHIRRSVATCEEGVAGRQSQVRNNHPMIAGGQTFLLKVIVESTTLAARLSNRLLMALARWTSIPVPRWPFSLQGIRELWGCQSKETGDC